MSGHFAHGQVATGTFEVPEEWLPLSKELASWARKRTGALGISTGVYPGCSQEFGVPAAWYHANKEIVIDPEVALPGQDPRSVDFNDSLWQNENPRLFGLMHHELGHGMGTAYSGADYARFGARPREVDVIMALEEPKAELTAVEMSGQRSVRYLRHTALELILAEWSIPDGAYGASVSAALLLAREDIGVFTGKDVQDCAAEITGALGAGTVQQLRRLWQEYLAMPATVEPPERLELARRWLALLPEEERSGGTAHQHLPTGSPVDDDDGGGQLARAVGRSVRRQSNDSDLKFVRSRRSIREKRESDTAARIAEEAGSDEGRDDDAAPGDRDGEGAGMGDWRRRSYRTGSRSPSPAERRGMTILADRLEKADFRARTVSRGTSDTPPGRLRHTAMQLDAAVDLGIPPSQTDVFSVRRLKTSHHPPLTVGLMTDVSGSMAQTVAALCTTQWMLSNAVEAIGGRLASMFFGVGHYRGLRVGERHDDVDVWDAYDGYETPYGAFKSLNHQLDLLQGDGARLLVIATDARWSRREEQKNMHRVMDLARAGGLHVIWATFTGWAEPSRAYRTGTVVDLMGRGPVESATIIGDAAVDLVQRSS